MSSLSDDPVDALEAELMKEVSKDKEKKEGETDQSEVVLCHPLKGLEGAGAALTRLRDEFHSYLKAVSDQIMKVWEGDLRSMTLIGGAVPSHMQHCLQGCCLAVP